MNGAPHAGSLGDLQRAFQDFLLERGDGFAGSVRDTRKADRLTLLGVYRDAYALRLIEVLANDYPGLMAVAGPADFDSLARAYIAAHPSRHPSVRWFGAHLPDFLAATAPYSGSPAAVEMARFEWALGEVFDAPDDTPIQAADLTALPAEAWGELRFAPLRSLRKLTLAYDVPQAWQRREDVEPGDLEVAKAARATDWVIWRPERTSHFRSLEPDEAAMLAAMIDGHAFPELCESLVALVGEEAAPPQAAGRLRSWVEEGMIGAFTR